MRKVLKWLSPWACVALAAAPATAQIRTDDTLGRAPRVLHGPDYVIGAELGRQAGHNLFHSFATFSLRAGQRATFSAPDEAEIRRVVSRVTGGQRSVIDGTILSTIPGADFYFINPAGVAFGQGASLDLQGSFHVSTADELRFADGKVFSAAHPTSFLTVAAPEAFGFLGSDPGRIDFEGGFLELPSGSALSLIGGDISIDAATIRAPGGAINIVALGGPGEASLDGGDPVTGRRADIKLRGRTEFSTTGDGGGTIRIRAGRFVLTEESALSANNIGLSDSRGGIDIEARSVKVADGASISASTSGAGDAGTVKVDADHVIVDGGGKTTSIRSDATQRAAGQGGLVTVDATSLDIRDGGEIRASTFGAGMAGSVEVDASRLLISGEGLGDLTTLTGISSQVQPGATGDGGTVKVTADAVEVRANGVIRSVTFSQGDAGTVTVETQRASLLGGGQISSSTFGSGDSGDVVVTARDALSITGQSRFQTTNHLFPPSGIFASTNSGRADAGAAGTAAVTAPVITIADHGEISSETRFGGGRGGQVSVAAAERLVVDAGEISTEATGSEAAGAITVSAGKLELRNGGSIHSNAKGDGRAGSVSVVAERLLLTSHADISTNSKMAGGGAIGLRVGDAIVLRDGAITTSVAGGEESTAGDITIDPDVLVIDHGRIQANAGQGQGGHVTISAANVLVPGADFDALLKHDITASGGDPTRDGTVSVNAPEVDLSGGLLVLESAIVDTAPLRARCGARRDIDASSFTGVGRAGLPPSPDGPLAGAWLGADLAPAVPAAATLPEAGRSSVLVLPCAPRS